MRMIEKPMKGEFAPYASMYIDLLPDDGRVLQHLKDNYRKTKDFILSLPEEKMTYRYSPGKWSIKEILVHIIDDERIYAYRVLRFARGDRTGLPGFEQDDFAQASNADQRELKGIFAEYEAVRNATVTMFDSFEEDVFLRAGKADGNTMSVRAAAYHIAGHELHHMNIIKERYL